MRLGDLNLTRDGFKLLLLWLLKTITIIFIVMGYAEKKHPDSAKYVGNSVN